MTKEEVIAMAREAGFELDCCSLEWHDRIERFAKLVRNDYSNKHAQLWLKRIDEAVKAEREACAVMCESEWSNVAEKMFGHSCATAVRERGNT